MKRCAGLLLLAVAVAVPLSARVISYAPYTNRVATPAFQERTTRHFVLIETRSEDFARNMPNEVVLYDSSGAEEPRVIAPKDGIVYEQSALYQKADGTPLVLTIGRDVMSPNSWMLAPIISVSEGGTNWRVVTGIGVFNILQVLDTDTGGPFTHGLTAPIVMGNDTWPFIVSLGNNGVWAIASNGTAKRLYQANDARVVGRNAAGDRFLIYSATALWITGIDGPATKLARVDPTGAFGGWITSNGTAYLQMLRPEGRFLFTAKDDVLQFIAGPYNTARPAIGAPPQIGITMRFFAVPTRDYEGAWIIQRDTGQPTKLSKHTLAGGLQLMWSDITGPQVEALITGSSGNSVLVQVHRERDGVELNRPFIDPALAVWRVGQPAPRAYEELYLNENWNKGFVHIDVEEIESGAPFVFNSGFEPTEAPVSRVSPPIAGGGDVIQEWGVVRASLKQRLVIPGVARLNGAFDSFWLTDLTVYNPLDEPQQVEVQFVPLGISDTSTTTITLEPFEIRAIPDALKTLFALEAGGGTLHFLPAVGINATSRTYSRKGNGTFGFGMQAIDYFNAAGPRFPLSFAGAFPGEHFRTNLLLTDTSGRGARAKLQASGVTGFAGSGDVALETPADTTVQLSGVGPAAGFLQSSGGGLLIEPTRGTAIATVVAIDNRTNDPTYFPPDLPASVVRAIPAIGHLDGANGSKFRSDVYLYNPANFTRTVQLAAKMWDSNTQKIVTFTLLPNESRVVPDALKTLFGMEGIARLRYSTIDWQPVEGVRVTSRTYTVDPSGATYGCLVPPLNSFQIGTFGDRLEILGISGGTGFRTNVGLVDLSDATQSNPRVNVTIVDDRRRVVDTFSVQIPARGGMQINDIFGARGLTPPPAAMVIVEIVEGQQIGAYATLTDNVTNDSTYLAAQLGAQPGN
ncbi:MAG TPA: hypothetical protein VGQ36_26460 [Thermoanaerobaculia bacterium]|jgi:hypothetical protein|nr:hypothetical protein [Thermoanaerobaculia bacterium]